MSRNHNFARGLRRLRDDERCPASPLALDEAIKFRCVDDPDGLRAMAITAISGIFASRYLAQMEYRPCESPIEDAFRLALEVYAMAWTDGDVLHGKCFEDGTHHEPKAVAPSQLTVCQQHHIGAYRVDFLLTGYEYDMGPRPDQAGIVRVSSVVVECDGHDFHERTKEQARRDRSRDRALQAGGYKVFRFTGSEIHADPFKCAAEAFDAAFARDGITAK